jgi:tyrosine-specific transport protein
MRGRSLGAVLMILGTSIGAGMIALPIAAAQQTFFITVAMLIAGWFLMTMGALALLEVRLAFGRNKNLISMAGTTLGKVGQLVSWVVYLMLLYSLLCAYMSGTSDVLHVILGVANIHIMHWLESVLVVLGLGYIIYRGIRSIDMVNRGLMFTKLGLFLLIALPIAHKITGHALILGSAQPNMNTFMVMLTSFGFATIIPSLVDYIEQDAKQLRKIVIWGSLIPLLIYILWIAMVQGIIPREQLILIATQGRTIAELISSIQQYAGTPIVSLAANIFISICAFTSFLGVALCIVDFLADGIKIDKNSRRGLLVYALAFIPSLLIVILAPNIFVSALAYAGICCIILLINLPIMMVFCGRYQKVVTHYVVPGGKIVLGIVFVISILLLIGLML